MAYSVKKITCGAGIGFQVVCSIPSTKIFSRWGENICGKELETSWILLESSKSPYKWQEVIQNNSEITIDWNLIHCYRLFMNKLYFTEIIKVTRSYSKYEDH